MNFCNAASDCQSRAGTSLLASRYRHQGLNENRNCRSHPGLPRHWPSSGWIGDDGPARTPRQRNSRTTRSILLRARTREEAHVHAQCAQGSTGPYEEILRSTPSLSARQTMPAIRRCAPPWSQAQYVPPPTPLPPPVFNPSNPGTVPQPSYRPLSQAQHLQHQASFQVMK